MGGGIFLRDVRRKNIREEERYGSLDAQGPRSCRDGMLLEFSGRETSGLKFTLHATPKGHTDIPDVVWAVKRHTSRPPTSDARRGTPYF